MASIVNFLTHSLRSAAVYNPEVQVAPACILWPDRERQWEAVVPRLQQDMQELCILGPWEPGKRVGPAIWLRCVLAGTSLEETEEAFQQVVEEAKAPYGTKGRKPDALVPIFYLPGVGRQDLRAVESCPDLLKPLAELQYRGALWSQLNAKDWTILAFLKSDQGGLGLDVAQDTEAKQAMQLSLYKLLDEDTDLLRGKRLDKDYFNKLLTTGDPTREILQWIDQGDTFKASRNETEWQAFLQVTKSQLAFNPEIDGHLTAAERLATHEGPWLPVWQRFCEAPARYPKIPDLLRRCGLPKDLFADRSGWPEANTRDEKELESALRRMAELPPHAARKRVRELDQEHGERRGWVWAEIGESPLARAVAPLAELARICEQPMAVGDLDDMVAIYTTSGWEADRAVMAALEEVETSTDLAAVETVIQVIYRPWLEDAARRFQQLVRDNGYPGRKRSEVKVVSPVEGEAWLFVDGLRYDLAQRLLALLQEDNGLKVETVRNWAALPSVTATAKPAVSPVAAKIIGSDVNADFEPSVQATGQSLKGGYQLSKLLKDGGWTVAGSPADADPSGSAWLEYGEIDHEGHKEKGRLAKEVDRLLREILGRIQTLIADGWSSIRVVTDHGFLFLPGGLPTVSLASSLSENTWGRCAAIKPGASSDEAHFSWFWNPSHTFALAGGISCYGKARDYTHGGLSLQECLTLEIRVRPAADPLKLANLGFSDSSWRGLRFTAVLESPTAGLRLDLRRHPGDPASSVVVSTKAFSEDGRASVVVEDDQLEGENAWAVVIHETGGLLAQQETIIGGKQ
jgi:hypothetical protein